MSFRDEFEECYFDSKIISDKYVYVFEKHNMALPIWGMIANKIKRPLNLITFDTHTDTLPAFSSYKATHLLSGEFDIQKVLRNPKVHFGEHFCIEDTFESTKRYVGFADQIETAMALGHLSSYMVVQRSEDVCNDALYFDENCNKVYFHRDYIDWNALNNISDPIALDFDLDYFHRIGEMDNIFENKIASLVKRADVITIALEPDCFEENTNGDCEFTNVVAFTRLIEILKNILQ